jgi:hypothetical protein
VKRTLTLRPAPARIKPRKPTPADPEKIARAGALGFRFVDREGRYILQARTVIYPESRSPIDQMPLLGRPEQTWVDIPLVPEVYG